MKQQNGMQNKTTDERELMKFYKKKYRLKECSVLLGTINSVGKGYTVYKKVQSIVVHKKQKVVKDCNKKSHIRKVMFNKYNLKQLVSQLKQNVQYTCKICSKKFDNETKYSLHVLTHKNKDCDNKQKENVINSNKFDATLKYRCHICHKRFAEVTLLRKHKDDTHNVSNAANVSSKNETEQHVSQKHDSVTPKSISNIQSNKNKQKEKIVNSNKFDASLKFRCHICRKRFREVTLLRKHKADVHNVSNIRNVNNKNESEQNISQEYDGENLNSSLNDNSNKSSVVNLKNSCSNVERNKKSETQKHSKNMHGSKILTDLGDLDKALDVQLSVALSSDNNKPELCKNDLQKKNVEETSSTTIIRQNDLFTHLQKNPLEIKTEVRKEIEKETQNVVSSHEKIDSKVDEMNEIKIELSDNCETDTEDEITINCEICQDIFSSKSEYESHLKFHEFIMKTVINCDKKISPNSPDSPDSSESWRKSPSALQIEEPEDEEPFPTDTQTNKEDQHLELNPKITLRKIEDLVDDKRKKQLLKVLKCVHCKHEFKKRRAYNKHMTRKLREPTSCTACNLEFCSTKRLLIHIEKRHEKRNTGLRKSIHTLVSGSNGV